jgi:hypothetical protein
MMIGMNPLKFFKLGLCCGILFLIFSTHTYTTQIQSAVLGNTRSATSIANVDSNKNDSAKLEVSKYNLTVVVPGLGDPRRMPVLKESLQTIQSSLAKRQYGFSCFVYVWNETFLPEVIETLDLCDVVYNVGMWVAHMKRVPIPQNNTATHFAIMMDDVDLKTNNVDTAHMLDWMQDAGYGLNSAAVPGWTWPLMHPRKNCTSHITGYADILFSVFKVDAWLCFIFGLEFVWMGLRRHIW